MLSRRERALLPLALLAGGALLALLALNTSSSLSSVQPSVLYSRSSLPPHWHQSTDSHGKPYYWNRVLATSSWNPPNADGTVADDTVSHNSQETAAASDSQAENAFADDGAQPAAADSQSEDQQAAMDAYDAATSQSGLATANAPTPQYQFTNTGDENWDGGVPVPLDAGADDSVEEWGADPSEDDAAQWDDSDDYAHTAVARQSDWDYAEDSTPSLDVSSPIQLHPVQQLSTPDAGGSQPDAEGEEDEKEISDITGYPDWPSDLPGAYGDDTSWIVGEHREPFWSDSMTNGCGLTTPCEKGRADRGHAFQKTVNPWTDKRRTFDPYAQATEEGRANYPWDPSKDPKYYGKGDCGDGQLTDECFERPTQDELDKKKQEWKRKYDEWYTGNVVGEGEEDSEAPESAQKEAATPLLTAPKELTPWAKRDIPGLGRKAANGHYAGGEPVAKSFGSVVKKVEGDLAKSVQSLSFTPLQDWGNKFFRARQERRPALEAEEEMLAQMAATSLKQKQQHAASAAKAAKEKQSAAQPKESESKSIWESPLEVVKRGLFGVTGSGDAKTSDAAASKEAAQALEKKLSTGKDAKKGPLPPALEDAVKVTESGEGKKAGREAKKTVKGWEEKVMQKGAMRRESTEKSMEDALKERDHKMLKQADGLSWSKLKSLQEAASDLEKDIAGAASGGAKHKSKPKAKSVKGWEEKEMQQGAMRHESVEQNLKAALGKRELGLLEHKAGWKSAGELQRALAFADNLEAAIKDRRKEEAAHPLIPKAAKKALHMSSTKEGEDLTEEREHHKKIKAEVREAADRRVVQRVREEGPIVKAYEAQVRDDEEEYKGEMAEEKLTLAKLHRDQGKLTRAIEAEEGTPRKHNKQKAAAGLQVEEGSLMKLRSLSKSKATTPAAPKHGLSAAQADKDLNSFFDSEGVH